MELTDEQRKQVEDTLWVVNAAMKALGIKDEDLRSEAELYLCSVVTRFDPARGLKLSTYAYSNTLQFLKRKREDKRKDTLYCCPLEYDIPCRCAEDIAIPRLELYYLAKSLGKKELIVLNSMKDDKTVSETVKAAGVSKQRITKIKGKVREKLKKQTE